MGGEYITRALRRMESGLDMRITNGDRWMVWDFTYHQWAVYERKRYQKKTRLIIRILDEQAAVAALIED